MVLLSSGVSRTRIFCLMKDPGSQIVEGRFCRCDFVAEERLPRRRWLMNVGSCSGRVRRESSFEGERRKRGTVSVLFPLPKLWKKSGPQITGLY